MFRSTLNKKRKTKMTTQNQNGNSTLPTHRVSFSRIVGQNEDGSDKLGPAREIGAVWARKGDKTGGILKLDHIPVELTRHQGVLFLVPTEQSSN
jgi:hypothetical protein